MSTEQQTSNFKSRCNKFLEASPILMLDGNWPSIGVLDLLSFSLRNDQQLANEKRDLLRGVALCVAEVVAKAWKATGAEVEVVDTNVTSESGYGRGILVRGKLPSEVISFYLEEELERALVELPLPFPVFVEASRPISFDTNVLSLFAIGAATGLHPAVDGTWPELKNVELTRHLDPILKELSRQSAAWYERVYPNEPVGQMPELYLNSLIYPPLLIDEALPAQRSSNQMLTYCLELKLKPASMALLAENLATSPDDLISQTGIALSLALNEEVSLKLAAICEAKGAQITLLRRAMLSLRTRLGMQDDWIERGIFERADEKRVELEKRSGLMPWLVLSSGCLAAHAKSGKLKPMLLAIADFDFDLALRQCNAMVDETPGDMDLRQQQVKLTIIKNDLPKAEALLRSLISEPDADRYARLFHLWGICRLEAGDIPTFKRYCRSGLAVCGDDNALASDLMNNLGWGELCEGNFEEALKCFSEAVPKSISPTTALVNKAHVLCRLKRMDEARAVQKELLSIAPCDRRVFASMLIAQ